VGTFIMTRYYYYKDKIVCKITFKKYSFIITEREERKERRERASERERDLLFHQ
jgi:hypothetical protein